jgi:hypothetical protein
MSNAEKFAALVELELQKLNEIEKDAVLGAIAGRFLGGLGKVVAGGGKLMAGAGRIGTSVTKAVTSGGRAITGAGKSLSSAGKALAAPPRPGERGLFAKIFTRPTPSAPPTPAPAVASRRVARAPAPTPVVAPAPTPAPPPAAGSLVRRSGAARPPAPPEIGQTTVRRAAKMRAEGAQGDITPEMARAPKKSGGKKKVSPGPGTADAGSGAGSTAMNVGLGATSIFGGGSQHEEKPAMNLENIFKKTAELANGASDDEQVDILAQVSMSDGFDGELLAQAQALGYDAGIAKTAADDKKDEEKDEKEEKEEGKDEEKKEKSLPPWLQKKTDEKKDEKKEDEKKSSARPILYNKFTAHDIAAHLQSQFGRQDPVEKDASVKKVSAAEKLAALVEKELAARPT